MKHSSLDEVHFPTIETSQFEMSVAGTEEAAFQDKANMLKVHKASPAKQLPPTTTIPTPITARPILSFPTKRFRGPKGQACSLTISNPHSSLMALIDAVYSPLHCTVCDHVSSTTEEANEHARKRQHRRELLCLHPHCEKIFRTRSALLFHIQQSHLVVQATITTVPPLIACATSSSSSSSLSSFSSSSSSPASATPTAITTTATTTLSAVISSSPSPIHAGDIDDDDENDGGGCDDENDKDSQSCSLSPSPQPASSFPTLIPTLSPPKKPRSPTWRVSSFPKIQTSRAPRGSKKIVLSPDVDAKLNTVYPPLQCPSCLTHFNRKTNVIKHLTDDHYGEEPYRCIFSECSHPKLYATREGLVYHILRVHDSSQSEHHHHHHHSSTIVSSSTKRKR